MDALRVSLERSPGVAHVAIKLPPFWGGDPTLWLKQIEALFDLERITNDKTKVNYLLSSLDKNILSCIKDILKSTDSPNYTTLKSALIKRCSESEEEKIKKLLSGLELGDRKLTELLREIRNLANPEIPDSIIKHLWFQKLPNNSQSILQVSNANLEELADIADRVVSTTQSTIFSCSNTNSDILNEMAALL